MTYSELKHLTEYVLGLRVSRLSDVNNPQGGVSIIVETVPDRRWKTRFRATAYHSAMKEHLETYDVNRETLERALGDFMDHVICEAQIHCKDRP